MWQLIPAGVCWFLLVSANNFTPLQVSQADKLCDGSSVIYIGMGFGERLKTFLGQLMGPERSLQSMQISKVLVFPFIQKLFKLKEG